ncbi:glyoxalase [Lactiplantibacillus sp. WILCCON 0030]|uniref:Glyoxalase n=1 Tax=Lactiplantibacillus brownii TaxID=3069269 RepID=A0ABU1ABQ7_9LACO|nr:VOC family protein [Lactiplantibacillus brownii]MDQ7938296.1 glyoxalase [Lactiplantibacillus brownii]
MQKTRIMIYVEDVDRVVKFWQDYFEARIETISSLPDNFKSIVLTISPTVELAFFPKAFIAKYSPEVLGNTPSLLFFSEQFKALHAKLPTVGDIVDHDGMLTFNFADPEGNYFAVAQAK